MNNTKKLAPRNRLFELRNRSHLTLEEVSTLTGFSVSTISRHESRNRSLDTEAVCKYASLYKVHTYELFDLSGDDGEQDQ